MAIDILRNCAKLELIENIDAGPFLSHRVPILPNLTALRASVNTSEEIRAICTKAPNLLHLELFNETFDSIPDMDVSRVIDTYPNLISLELYLIEPRRQTLRDMSSLTELRTLSLYGVMLTDGDMYALAEQINANITCLQLGSSEITFRGIWRLVSKLPELASLDIEYTGAL